MSKQSKGNKLLCRYNQMLYKNYKEPNYKPYTNLYYRIFLVLKQLRPYCVNYRLNFILMSCEIYTSIFWFLFHYNMDYEFDIVTREGERFTIIRQMHLIKGDAFLHNIFRDYFILAKRFMFNINTNNIFQSLN